MHSRQVAAQAAALAEGGGATQNQFKLKVEPSVASTCHTLLVVSQRWRRRRRRK